MMNKESMEYFVNQIKPEFVEHEGKLFSNKEMYRVHEYAPLASALKLSTLDSFIDYIESETDRLPERMLIHIESPTSVQLIGNLNDERNRECIATVSPIIPEFSFGKFYDSEEFTIKLMAMFCDGQNKNEILVKNDKEIVLKYIGTAQAGTLKSYGDDGISQSVTIQKTTTSKDESIVPNPVTLYPYRTFLEVEQPGSPFIFRMKEFDNRMCAALFEADGGKWRSEAIESIKRYLKVSLEGFGKEFTERFTVIG